MKTRLLTLSAFAAILLASCSWFSSSGGNAPTGGDEAQEMSDGVTMKDGMMLSIEDGQMSRMEKDVKYADGTSVSVDGMVKLADGTTLKLPEGMMVATDGKLRMRDGVISAQEPTDATPPSSSPAGAKASAAPAMLKK